MPELIRKQAETLLQEFCSGAVPAAPDTPLTYVLEDDCFVLLAAEGAGAADRTAIARFCYNEQLQQWTLHRPDPERQWRFYPNSGPSLNLHKLLRHVAEDPLRAFWP